MTIQHSLEVYNFSMAQSKRRHQLYKAMNSYGESLDYGIEMRKKMVPTILSKFEELKTTKGATRKKMWKEVVMVNENKWTEIAECLAISIVSSIVATPKLSSVVKKAQKMMMLTLGYSFSDIEETAAKYKPFILYMIEVVREETDIFHITSFNGKENYIDLAPHWLDVVKKSFDEATIYADSFKPMVEKPIRHTDLVSPEGGYYTFSSPLLKYPTKVNGKVHPSILNFTAETQPEFFAAVNKVQETPFCVNTALLELIETHYDAGFEFDGYPRNYDLHAHKVQKAVNAELDRNSKKGWKTNVQRTTRLEEAKIKADILKTATTFQMANDYSSFDAIYFPVFFDDRGRRYTYPSDTLSYLGTSLSKALVHFSNKERLTITGVKNMFAALGNALGNDKKSISLKTKLARQWWKANKAAILNNDWSVFFSEQGKMDEPINAMSICLELVKFKTDKTWKTGYPFHLDARCSGMSIIGTLLKDKSTMELTSVLDIIKDEEADLPDAYTAVANDALNFVETCELPTAQELLVHRVMFKRKVFKKPVMTLAYGASQDTRRKEAKDHMVEEEIEMSNEAFALFSKSMETALHNVSPSCMEYLKASKTLAKQFLNKGNEVLAFTVPMTNFPATFKEYVLEESELRIKSDRGQSRSLIEYTKTDDLDINAMVRWLAPSIIHGVDAGILHNVSDKAEFDICTIHDSFASHPNHTQKLRNLYAASMVELFDSNALDSIFADLGNSVEVPYVNTWTDSSEIMNSLHIIC